MRSLVRFRCVDVLAVTFVAGSVATVVMAAGVSKHELASRIKCASNLHQLGQAIALYANENRGAYPRTPYKADAPPIWGTPYAPDNKAAGPSRDADPFATEGNKNNPSSPAALANRPHPNDVTAAMFLLLRTEDLVPEEFICPGTTLKRWDYGNEEAIKTHQGDIHGAQDFTNFFGTQGIADHLSYSYQNPYPSPQAMMAGFKLNNSIPAEFAVMADMNPSNKALLNAQPDAAPKNMAADLTADQRALNSLNHLGDGQNVLFGDGHVAFTNTPFVGQHRDNIYVAGDIGEARKTGKPAFAASSADATDNILLPTAADVGQTPESSDMPPLTDAEVAAAKKKFAGNYENVAPDNEVSTMVIDDTSLTMTHGSFSLKYTYRIVGRRLQSVLIELTDPKGVTRPAEMWMGDDGLNFETQARIPSPWKKQPAP